MFYSHVEILQPWTKLLRLGKFCIPGRPRTSACFRAKAKLMRVNCLVKHKQAYKNAAELLENKENLKRFEVPVGLQA